MHSKDLSDVIFVPLGVEDTREKQKQSVHERQRKTVLRGEETTLRVGGVGGRGGCDKDAQKNKKKKDKKKKQCI